MIRAFTEDTYFKAANNFGTAIADGKFPASGSYIRVGDFERFAFVVRAGAVDSALTLQVYQDTAATETAGVKVVTGAADIVGTGDDNDLFIIEVETRKLDISNGFDFVTLGVSGAAGSNDYLDILFVGINPTSAPVTQDSSTYSTVIAG